MAGLRPQPVISYTGAVERIPFPSHLRVRSSVAERREEACLSQGNANSQGAGGFNYNICLVTHLGFDSLTTIIITFSGNI